MHSIPKTVHCLSCCENQSTSTLCQCSEIKSGSDWKSCCKYQNIIQNSTNSHTHPNALFLDKTRLGSITSSPRFSLSPAPRLGGLGTKGQGLTILSLKKLLVLKSIYLSSIISKASLRLNLQKASLQYLKVLLVNIFST